MRFAHLSDFHCTTMQYNHPTLRSDLNDALASVVKDVSKIEQHLDFVSITGDLTESGDAESYSVIGDLLSTLDIPVYVVPGNHDSRAPFQEAFSSRHEPVNRETLDYRAVYDSIQVLGLDTLLEGEVGGILSEEQLLWVQDMLIDGAYTHTVISMHHPPFAIGHVEFDAIATLEGRERFGELVRQSRSEVIILCGHIHRPYQATWNGASCYIAGGPSSQMGSQFCFGDDPLDVVQEPFTYFIHDINEVAGHRVGMRYVRLE